MQIEASQPAGSQSAIDWAILHQSMIDWSSHRVLELGGRGGSLYIKTFKIRPSSAEDVPAPLKWRTAKNNQTDQIGTYLWISKDVYGYAWICMDMHIHAWICMDMRGYPWISMDIHWHPWISMDIHEYLWISMDIHGFPRISMDIHG